MPSSLPFLKANALGNDFVIVEESAVGGREPAELARVLCDRHAGIGADGLLVVDRSVPGADAQVRTFNSDGSEAELSGNGLRAVAAWLAGEAEVGRRVSLTTVAGNRSYTLVERRGWHYTFDAVMGPPIFEPEQIPFKPAQPAMLPIVDFALKVGGSRRSATVLSMGNPQCVIFVDDFDRVDWRAIGRAVERHPFFPQRTNVAFVRLLGPQQIAVRFWERGAGETLSSGTGACAAAVAAVLRGMNRQEIFVEAAGGEMRVHWPEGGEVYLTGTVDLVARGEFFPPMG